MIFSEQSEPRFVAMITSLVVPIFYGILTAAFAASFFYNVSVRLHGGIRLELEFLETPPPKEEEVVKLALFGLSCLPRAGSPVGNCCDKLGMSLTESWQWVPEQSTAALFTHHPDAKYYSVGNLDRAAQILG